MKLTSGCLAALLSLAVVAPQAALADKNKGHCPPGLAKKNPPCVPPGQAKKGLGVGDRFPQDGYYVVREGPGLPRLGKGESYYRIGDTYFRVDQNTREILQLFEAVGAVVN